MTTTTPETGYDTRPDYRVELLRRRNWRSADRRTGLAA